MASKVRIRSLRRVIIVCGVFALLCYFAISMGVSYNNYRALASEKANLEQQTQALQQAQEQLKKDVDYTKTEQFVEETARSVFGWVKPGDIRYIGEE